MKLWEIEEALYDCINDETGQVNQEHFDNLQGLRRDKLEGIALAYKNLVRLAEAIKVEEDTLKSRRKAVEKKAEGLKNFLASNLSGENLETARVKISWRNSQTLEILDEKSVPEMYLKFSKPTLDRRVITTALKEGKKVPGAVLVKRAYMQIDSVRKIESEERED